MTTYANIEVKVCSLANDWGRDYAMRIFNLTEAELERLVGRITRGPRKGMLAGMIGWSKCMSGGWQRLGHYDHDAMRGNGRVLRPGTCFDHRLYDRNGKVLREALLP